MFSDLSLFVLSGLALNLTPGPDMLYVATRSAAEGRDAGIASSLGIAVGCLVHLAMVTAGLSAVLAAVPAAYDVVSYAGAAYLAWLGVRALTSRTPLLDDAAMPPASLARIFRQGVATNVLNPKVALFFLALLPQFVDPSRGSAAMQILILGLIFNTTGTTVNMAVALGASRATVWLRARRSRLSVIQRASGVVFLGLSARLALSARR